jgi:AbrB family looped-hinge helix DNA binding protein
MIGKVKSFPKSAAAMDVTIDNYGRIVIPKPIRDRLGLESGSSLTLEIADSDENGESITLRPQGQEPPLQQKGNLLVHTGRLTDENFDVVEQLRDQRAERAQRHAGISE